MTLIINNHDVEQLLTMERRSPRWDECYSRAARPRRRSAAAHRHPHPTSDPAKNYQWGTMEGGSTGGYFAIRMKSDIIYETGVQRRPDAGEILHSARPVLRPDPAHLDRERRAARVPQRRAPQHMRVGADGGIGVKYMANEDAEVVGMLGSGGMARTHMEAFTRVRTIKKLQVFSPTQARTVSASAARWRPNTTSR